MKNTNILHFIKQQRELISLTSFDTSTEQGRSKERHRRIALTAIASAAAKIITIATSLITVPLTLNYLGAERYGLWMTISSVIAMMTFADFGIGNGLMNAVAEAYGKNDKNALKSHITNAFIILSIIPVVILILFFTLFPFVDWGSFFNVKSTIAIQESGPTLAVFAICFAMGMPAGVVQRVQMGLQQGFTSSLWQAAGSVLSLLLILLIIGLRGGLPWLVLAYGGVPVISLLLNGLFYFIIQRRDLIPEIVNVSKTGMVRILQGGLLFFVLQLTVTIAYTSDNIIIAKVLGASFVSQYSVVSKLFEGILMVQGLAIMPLWPAYGEAKARDDKKWIKTTLSKTVSVTAIVILPIAIILVLLNKPIFSFWIGAQHIIPFSLVAWYGVWFILKGIGATYSMFFNGMNILRFQVILSCVFMISSISAKLYFITKFGLPGLLIGLILTYFSVSLLPQVLYSKKFIGGLTYEDTPISAIAHR